MKWYLKLLIAIASVVVLVICLNVGLNWWIARQLPIIINQNNKSPYHITYESAEVMLIDRVISAKNIIIVPKASLDAPKNKAGIYAKVPALTVSDYKLWDLIWSRKIQARLLTVSSPEVTLYKNSEKAIESSRSISNNVVAPFSKIIFVRDVILTNGSIKILSVKTNKPSLDVTGISVKLDGILITENTLKQKIPFGFENYELRCARGFYRANHLYDITSDSVRVTPASLSVSNVKLVPKMSRANFIASTPQEKDLFAVSAGSVKVDNVKWGFRDEKFFANASVLELMSVYANIYRPKMPPDDLSRKKLYSELLRNIPYDISVDTFRIRRSRIEYEEEKDRSHGAGKVVFGNFNLYATGVKSGFGRTKMPDTRIAINCRLMNTARVKVNWRFNVLDKSDSFAISGNVFGLPVESMAPFTKPYMNVEAKGDLDEIYFAFNGNSNRMKGTFGINYDDLKVQIFRKKDRKKKNKFLTAIANLFVKNDTKEKVKKTDIAVERIKEKSFFNLLWRGVAEGLKKILV